MATVKKPTYGASLYYASDKNVFDALNQHKVDIETVISLFAKRNIIISRKTERDELAKYFSRFTHDYYDHKTISHKLGVMPRRERITSMDIATEISMDDLQNSIDKIQQELEQSGDTVQISRNDEKITINIQFSTIDYRRSEFAQVQVRDGTIEFIKKNNGYVVRNSQNDYLNNVRESLFTKVEKVSEKPIEKTVVSLFEIVDAKLRTKFFVDLSQNLEKYDRRDVTDAYVYKAKPNANAEDEDSSESDTHIEKVFLKGYGVTRSELLNKLLDQDNYYIVKMGWTVVELNGDGNMYEIESVFSDPKNCTGFSFLLSGVYPLEDSGKYAIKKRAPSKDEVDKISLVIEKQARLSMLKVKEEFKNLSFKEEGK